MSRRLQVLLWSGAALLGGGGWLVFGAGGVGLPDAWSICLARRTFGLACPGCGMTRAMIALLQGDLAGAFRLHPLAPVLALEASVVWAGWGLWLAGRLTPPPFVWVQAFLLGHVGALLGLWVGRLATGTLPV